MVNRMLCLCLGFMSLSSELYALTSDRLQDVYFRAGHASFDEKTGQGIYDNEVTIDQGTSHLRATHATTTMDKQHRLTRAAAFGSPLKQAHFWTQTALDKPYLHGYADTIYYHPVIHQLELIGHARITQGENTLTAPNIRYDTQAERLITTIQNNEGTVIRINPKQHPEKNT
jgi:lipopolysaccharide export system protein LptA